MFGAEWSAGGGEVPCYLLVIVPRKATLIRDDALGEPLL